jgi:hypothetical protein
MMESMSNGDVPGSRRRGGLGGLLLNGEADGTEQVCSDPKTCPQPGLGTEEALLDADLQVCSDPKTCPQPATPADPTP